MRSVVLWCVVVVGCASGGRARNACEAVPPEYATIEGLYRNCDVDQRVRLISTPTRADFSRLEPLTVGAAGCYQAHHQFVVDERGVPVMKTVRLLRTNSQSYATIMRDGIGTLKFEPAKKNGLPVPQVFDYVTKVRYTVTVSGSPGSRRPPPC